MYDLATLTLAHEEHLDDVVAGYGGDIEIDVIRAYWSLRSLMEIRWLVSTATARRRRSQRRGAELLVIQFLVRAAITHVRRPALTIRSADRNVGTGATGRGTKRALRRHRCPLENRELGGACR